MPKSVTSACLCTWAILKFKAVAGVSKRLPVKGYTQDKLSAMLEEYMRNPVLSIARHSYKQGSWKHRGAVRPFLFSYRHPESGFCGAGRPTTWITIWFLYFEQNTHKKLFIKAIMCNATSTNSHINVEEHLVLFPRPVAWHPTSGPLNSNSDRHASPKRECLHWPSSSGVSPDSAYSLILFRYDSREKF